MDATSKTALIGAVGTVVVACISAYATIIVAGAGVKDAARAAKTDAAEAKSAVAKAGSMLRYVYDNGSITETDVIGGKMIVRVNGSQDAGPVSVPIDMNRFEQLCGDADGCTLTLGATRFHPQQNGHAISGYVIKPPLQGSPCRFFWDTPTKSWTLSQACVATYGLYTYKGTWPSGRYEFDQPYQVYEFSSTFGVDDSDKNGKDTDSRRL